MSRVRMEGGERGGKGARAHARAPALLSPLPVIIPSILLVLLITHHHHHKHKIYLPRIPGVPDAFPFYPDRFGLEYEDCWLTAGDGTKLHAWLLKPPGTAAAAAAAAAAGGAPPPPPLRLPVLIFFQENAGNMAMRLPFLRALVRSLGCAVLAPSYRGYGLSEGSPTEAGLRLDAAAALEHARSRADLDPARIALFGRSLGGAVALAAAAASSPGAAAGQHHPLAGVVVENTFLSIEAVAPALLPVLRPFLGPGKPLGRLLRSKWRNDESAAALAAAGPPAAPPVLLLSSLKDEMLPPAHMRQLWFALGGEGEAAGEGGRAVPLRQDAPAAPGKAEGGQVAGANGGGASSGPGAPRVRWVAFEEGRHLDAYDGCAALYWPALVEFAREAGFAAP